MPTAPDTVFQGSVSFEKPLPGTKGGQQFKRHYKTITTAHLTDADTSQDVDLATGDDGVAFPANAKVLSGHCELQVVVAGGTISAVTISLGDAVAANELMLATSVFTGAALGRKWAPGAYASLTVEAAYAPIARIAFTGGNANTATTCRILAIIDYWLPDAL